MLPRPQATSSPATGQCSAVPNDCLQNEGLQHHIVPVLGSGCSVDNNDDKQRKALLATAQAFGLEEVTFSTPSKVGPQSCMDQVHIGPRDALLVTAQAFGLEELFLESPVYNNTGTHTDDSFFGVCRCTQKCPDTDAPHGVKRRKLCGQEGELVQGCMSDKLVLPGMPYNSSIVCATMEGADSTYPAVWEECASTVLDWSAPWVAMAAPLIPHSYGDSFKPEAYEPCYLEMVNPHPTDVLLDFDVKSHTYRFNGRVLSGSVTAVATACSKPFDASRAILSMQNSRSQSWPRLRYVLDAVPLTPTCECQTPNLCRGVILTEAPGCNGGDGRTRAVLLPGELGGTPWPAVYEELIMRAQKMPGPPLFEPSYVMLFSFEREMTDDEIKVMWNTSRTISANHGTDAHYQIELWLNHDGHRGEEPEVVLAKQFVSNVLADLGAKLYRTEWRIFSANEDLAGSIDLAVRLPSGALALIDWKRSDKLRKGTRSFGGMRMAAPLDHLEDCKCAIYALQLNLYRWLLEAHYGERVALMILCSVHPEAPFVTAVPDLGSEVRCLMAQRRREHAAVRRAEAIAPPHLLCAQSEQLLTDPVRLNDGRAYQRGCAKRLILGEAFSGGELHVDEPLREEV